MGKVSSHGWELNIMAICGEHSDKVVRRGRRLARSLEKPFAGI